MDWDLSLCGLLEMVAEIRTAATVMAMLLVLIPSQLALSVKKTISHGTWKDAPLHSLQLTAVENRSRNK